MAITASGSWHSRGSAWDGRDSSEQMALPHRSVFIDERRALACPANGVYRIREGRLGPFERGAAHNVSSWSRWRSCCARCVRNAAARRLKAEPLTFEVEALAGDAERLGGRVHLAVVVAQRDLIISRSMRASVGISLSPVARRHRPGCGRPEVARWRSRPRARQA